MKEYLLRQKNKIILISIALIVLNVLVWKEIALTQKDNQKTKMYFLNVGQGDSELIILNTGAKIMIDGGAPNGQAASELDKVLGIFKRRLDLVVLTHAELDHFGGLIAVLKKHKVGAFVWNGVPGKSSAFDDLKKGIRDAKIQEVIIKKGDRIRQGDNDINVLWPMNGVTVKNLNDASVILEVNTNKTKTLFTGDAGINIEQELLPELREISILKVGHHGSKYSTGEAFLKVLQPQVAIIGVGKNSYGHPTKETLGRLKDVGATILRTDEDGTVELIINSGSISILRKLFTSG